jgi:8-oxo-dGTP pyrophosphatase MutT (NUDIX family)
MFDAPAEAKRPRAVRPRDAATLIILRRRKAGHEILMGKRSAAHRFMPGKFVFPGGRLDASDLRISHDSDLRPEVLTRLALHGGEAKARGLARAAIRETFEEVGLVLGRPSPQRRTSRNDVWRHFLSLGVEPDLSSLAYVARAITPPFRDRRFDTRFFIADAEALHDLPERPRPESGELLELAWVTLPQARELDLPNITRRVLDEVEARADDPHADKPVPFFRFAHGKAVWDTIG